MSGKEAAGGPGSATEALREHFTGLHRCVRATGAPSTRARPHRRDRCWAVPVLTTDLEEECVAKA